MHILTESLIKSFHDKNKNKPEFRILIKFKPIKKTLACQFFKSTKSLIGPKLRENSEFVFGCVRKQFSFSYTKYRGKCAKKIKGK